MGCVLARLADLFSLWVLELRFRSMETSEARAMRILTEVIESVGKEENNG